MHPTFTRRIVRSRFRQSVAAFIAREAGTDAGSDCGSGRKMERTLLGSHGLCVRGRRQAAGSGSGNRQCVSDPDPVHLADNGINAVVDGSLPSPRHSRLVPDPKSRD